MTRGRIPPTVNRPFSDQGHQVPSGKHSAGRLEAFGNWWRGTSKVHNRAARRRSNAKSWTKLTKIPRQRS